MKWILAISFLTLIAPGTNPAQAPRLRYPRFESYEIRPGVLATPKYAGRGGLCEIFIEKRHLQGDTVELEPTMPRELVLEMIDELVPRSERGKATMQLAGFDYIDQIDGATTITFAEYERVSIQIYRATSGTGDTAAIVKWKNACGSSQKPGRLP
jgi:hypothetical protein